ncbi:MAG: transcriptional activator RfaH [Alphaproteobacteria bacterium]|nr:transcriptional activator RfaH [Alphaproteobacteria bacterium]
MAERNLHRQDFQTFLPLHEETKRRSGRFISTLRPLFTGYLFVAFDTANGGWRAINNTYGVTRLVSFGDQPQPVPLDLISRLMLRCDAGGKLLPPRILQPGDAVRLTSGPFAEFVATVEKISPDQRVWVLLDLMGRTTRVAVQAEALQVVCGFS